MHRLACTELLPVLALATIPSGSGHNRGHSGSKGGSSSSNIAGQVLSVLSDFKSAAAAFLATVSAEMAEGAEQQAAEGFWQGPEDFEDASLAAGGGFGGSPAMQAYCVAAAAYVAAACCSAAEASAAEAAGVTLRALCGVLGVQEGVLGSAWTLGGGVYAGWCRAMLGASGSFADPATAVADSAAAAAEDGSMDEGAAVSQEDILQGLHASTQRCLRLSDLLADAASAVRTTGSKGSWWGNPAAQLTLSGMTAAVGGALVRLGVASSQAAGGTGQMGGRGLGEGGVRGLLMVGGDQGVGQMLAAAAVASIGA